MKILSWNVNGIKAWIKKGGDKELRKLKPDIICLQEVKSKTPVEFLEGYHFYFNLSKKGNYAGTLTMTKEEPLSVTKGLGIGNAYRSNILTLEFESFFLVNVYCPSSVFKDDKQDRRQEWDDRFLFYIYNLSEIMPVIVCGDFNVQYDDNKKRQLYSFEKDKYLNMLKLKEFGFTEAFTNHYPGATPPASWWSPKGKRERTQVGRRLDYFFLSHSLPSKIENITYHADIYGSDHCPVTLEIDINCFQGENEKEYGYRWHKIDWNKAKLLLRDYQIKLARAAKNEDDAEVARIQNIMHNSLPIRELAVKEVFDHHFSAMVNFKSSRIDEMKMKMALELTPENYEPKPYFEFEHEEKGKRRRFGEFCNSDMAMHRIMKWTLAPVLEATTDTHSFAFRERKGVLDAHSYLKELLESDFAPEYIVYVDIRLFYERLSHEWLMENVPVNKTVLKKILGSLSMFQGELIDRNGQGVSLGSSFSPFLANYMLEGLQHHLYQDLYGTEKPEDKRIGDITRFADDIVVTVNDEQTAAQVLRSVQSFLAERHLEINMEKSKIASIHEGFNYMSWNYRKYGDMLIVTPTRRAIEILKENVFEALNEPKATLKHVIEVVNRKLNGWAIYHRYCYAAEAFWEIDCEVTKQYKKMVKRRWRVPDEVIENNFMITLNQSTYCAHPNDKSKYIIHLSDIPLAKHRRVNLSANPFLDEEYYEEYKTDHDIETVTGDCRSLWYSQGGHCAICGEELLSDQEIEIFSDDGRPEIASDKKYIHKSCKHAHPIEISSADGLDYFLDFQMTNALLKEKIFNNEYFYELGTRGQYENLRVFFHELEANKITLNIEELEEINGSPLPESLKKGGVLNLKKRRTLKSAFHTEGYIFTKKFSQEKDSTTFVQVFDQSYRLEWPKELNDHILDSKAVYEINRFLRYLERHFG